MAQNLEIKEIITGCIKGDKKYQEILYKTFYGKMMAICLRYTTDKDEAKDILQEGFLKAFLNLSKFDYSGSFEGWLRRIFVNTSIDYYRKIKTLHKVIDYNAEVEGLNEVTDSAETLDAYKSIDTKDILDAVQKLTPVYRAVFNMYAIDGFNHQQIAEELNISVGTSKSNYFKAKQNLQKLLMKKLKYQDEIYE
jgi:RNA polymerase sigma-70 factor, ECF subfamily